MPQTDHLIKGPGPGDSISISGRSDEPLQVKLHVGNTDNPVEATVAATIHGDPLKPIAAHVSSPSGQAIAAQVGATINGGTPVTAIIGGGATPINAAVTATVTAPVRLDVGLGDVGLRNTTVKFKLFGLLTILTMEVGP